MEFIQIERITGDCIGKAILKFYKDIGVNIRECKGQCYDGAANMQSLKKGAASYVLKESPTEIINRCCSHNLNLSHAALFRLPEADNILKTCKAVIIFFNNSPKWGVFQSTFTSNVTLAQKKQKVLVGLCKSRWSERGISCKRFYIAVPFIVEGLEIINSTHPEKDQFESVDRDGWDPKTKQEASSYLHAVKKFEFITGLVSLF